MIFKLLLFLTLLPTGILGQTLNRNKFDYENLKTDSTSNCNNELLTRLNDCFIAIEENNSKEAVRISKEIYNSKDNCPEIHEVYAYSLFRSGEWFDGIEIIEKGIEKFGAIPELIKRRSEMSLEMAELGIAEKNIDGSAVYKANSLKYDEDQFKEENLKSALLDLEYLMLKYHRSEEIYYTGKIYQLLRNYDKSTELLRKLLTDSEYKNAAIFEIADNYMATEKYKEAEAELSNLLKEFPRDGHLYEKMAKIAELKNDSSQQEELKRKAVFFKNLPSSSSLEFSKTNYDLLLFFAKNEKSAEKKLETLKKISKENRQDYAIDVCLMILQLHTNHGNGVEEEATEILTNIGKPSINKVHEMFLSDVSTCTITNLAEIMATLKDDESWKLLLQYLPTIANMPMTLIPPAVPEKLVKFDEDKGIKEILQVVRPILTEEENDDDMNSFGQYVYFVPLKKISRAKLKKIATELDYSNIEFRKLEEKLR